MPRVIRTVSLRRVARATSKEAKDTAIRGWFLDEIAISGVENVLGMFVWFGVLCRDSDYRTVQGGDRRGMEFIPRGRRWISSCA